MAEPEQESELLDASVSHCLSHHTDIVDASHEQEDQDEMNEELLSQALVDANAFDASAIGYAVTSEEGEVCDTVQGHACVVSDGLIVDNSGPQSHISSHGETILVHSSESILTNTSEAIFSNGTHCHSHSVSLLTNGATESEDLGVEESSDTFDVGSLPDGHIISIPSDIIPGSVIVSQSNEEQFQQSVVDGGDETQLLQDEIQQMDSHYVHSGDDQILQHSAASQLIQSGTIMQPHTITVSAASGVTLTQEVLQNVIQQIQAQQLAQQQSEVVAAAHRKNIPTAVDTAAPNTVSFTLVSPGQHNSNSPPLGSSQNPIRIIQQGNRYTPMQQLTQEQLQQIMQVVQQQHVNKNTQENGGAVIFNPQTNTRIMYRVIYPSELHKAQNGASLTTTYQVVKPTTSSQEQQTATAHQKRLYRKRKDVAVVSGTGEDEDKDKNISDVPELSKEEKEERKKHRPRTRSGRVSKPPKHMVQDYKRIHVLDWDEDYDDSDGGYSDFKHSDEEGKIKQEGEEEHSTSPEFFQALGAGRPKNHKCQTCDKSYIGQAGLARHYRLNPDHCTNLTENGSILSLHNGSIDGDDSKDASLPPDGSFSRMSDGVADVVKTNFNASSIENISEDSNTQDSLNSTGATSPVVPRGRGRGGFRGRWAHLKHNALIRRKNKLRELIKQCSDEDLMEVVLPRLVSSVSLWEYLMMKSENGGARPQVDVICREFETLRQHVKQACAEYMQPLTLEELEDDNLQCKMIKVSDKNLAMCLNLEPVTYRVKEMPPGDSSSFSSLHSRLSSAALTPSMGTAAPSIAKHTSVKVESNEAASDMNVKRYTSSDEMDESAAKRCKISNVLAPVRDTRTAASYSVTVASTAQYTDSKVNVINAEPTVSSALSSLPSVTSLQSAQVHGHSSAISLPPSLLSSSLSSPQNVTAASKSTSLNIRSPYIHISCPTTKQQPVFNTLAGPRRHSPASSKASKSHPVPVVINESADMPESRSHMLPYIVSTSSSLTGQQKLIFATPESQTLQTGTLPVVLATSVSQQSGSTTVLLTTGSTSSGPNVIVRQPAETVQPHAHVILTNQPSSSSSSSRPQKGCLSTSSLFPSPSLASNQTLTMSTNPRSLLGIVKPTEVRVSRQLFHDTTTPPLSSSSVVTNGHGSIKTGVASVDLHPVLQHFNAISAVAPTSCQPSASITSAIVSNSQQILVRSAHSNKTLMTPPSGQQFSTSPSKTVINSHMSGVDDISVLAGMDLSGDELGPLNTSSDSLNGALSGCSHLADSLMTADVAATSSVSETADESPSLIDMVHIVNSDMPAFDAIGKASLSSSDAVPLVNGNCSSYNKTKERNINTQTSSLSSPSSSLPLTLSETSDFIHISKPANLVSPCSQDSTSIMQPTIYHMTTNGPISSRGLKSDVTISSSVMMSDISSLPFTSQTAVQIVDTVSGQLGGISPILASDELQENGISILSEPMSVTDVHEADGQNMDMSEVAISDSLTGEDDGQLLLSEGTNIYQTEDGTIIIQKANGNTYQLQGAQGLSLETVQALLAGTLDQLVGVDVVGESIQTDMHLH